MSVSKRKKVVFYTFMILLISTISLISIEGILRLTGHEPWRYRISDNNIPTFHQFDSTLGWKNKEGEYEIPAFTPNGKDITMTFLNNGSRYTGSSQIKGYDNIVFIGGSNTQGWAISDHETYTSKIQEKHPTANILNYGTAAYGTYQSLLMLERIFKGSKTPVQVVYGFTDSHHARNVAHSAWLKMLALHSRRAHVYVPYVTINEIGKLERHPPEGYGPWPFRERLALAAFLQDVYMKRRDKYKFSHSNTVTAKLVMEMHNLCKKNNAKFLIALLEVDEKEKSAAIEFFNHQNIDFVDCAYPITNDMIVPGEFHPNEKMNTLWADCISRAISN